MAHAEIRADGKRRCPWAESAPEFPAYHDTEWGFPVADDVRLFEKLCLEGFQSGLSWRTILVKRDNFRTAFAGFDFHVLASWGEPDVCRLLQNAGIVRHRGKIEAVLNNAQRACELVTEAGSLAAFLWQYEPDPNNCPLRRPGLRVRSPSRCPGRSRSGAGSSWDRPRCMRSCSRWAWSTIMP